MAIFHYRSVYALVSVTIFYLRFVLIVPGNTEHEQAENSPSDEGFTELEPTVNGSTEEAEGLSSITVKNHQELGPHQADEETESKLDSIKGKLDEEEDEGVAQNSSMEEGESMQLASETEKQGDKLTTQELMETTDTETKGTGEPMGDVRHRMSSVPLDLNREASLTQASEVHGPAGLKRQSPDRPTSGSQMSEMHRRRKSYDAELKSWLLEKIQAPIEGIDLIIGFISSC